MVGIGRDRQLLPLAAGVQAVEDVVEHFVERNFAFVTPFGCAQARTDMLRELVFGYTDWNSAHGDLPLAGFFSMMHYQPFSEKFESLHYQFQEDAILPKPTHDALPP